MDIHVFVVDDDVTLRESLVHFLKKSGLMVTDFDNGEDAFLALGNQLPDVIVSDVKMPGWSGLELQEALKKKYPTLPMVLVSAHGDVPMAVKAMQDGAYSFLEKPFKPQRLLTIIDHAAQAHRLFTQNARLKKRLSNLVGLDRLLLGDTQVMENVREDIIDLADTEAAILVLGETGTGKEVVARAIHDLSARVSGPFIAVNCAAIPQNLFEASMFGHVSGAFTGANKASKGFFASAHQGTLFLDELVTCPLEQQAKLLRVLETREVIPVGSAKPIAVNIRIVSATNETLEKAVAEGRFREDLYYRLNTMEIVLPPLRDRVDDIALLFTHFLNIHAQTYECEPPEISSADLTALLVHKWPGNVRELCHLAERRILSARRGRGSVGEIISRSVVQESQTSRNLKEAISSFEKSYISKVLENSQAKMDDAARKLGISRRTLNEKLVKLDICRTDYID